MFAVNSKTSFTRLVTTLVVATSGLLLFDSKLSVYGLPQQSSCDPDLGCGNPNLGCPARCPLGFPCVTNDDCDSGSCSESFCDINIPTPIPVPTPPPPPTTSSWSLPNFSSGDLSGFGTTRPLYGLSNIAFVADPAGGSDIVMQVSYPARSFNPSTGLSGGVLGGTGFYGYPIDLSTAKSVKISMQIYFPEGFNFVKGGKLPGLYGGHAGCTGGRSAGSCFSTRFMFRTSGKGEVYAYVDQTAQVPEICAIPPLTICDPRFGISIGRGAWVFTPGQWNTVEQTITLNTVGQQDGSVLVSFNGNQVILFDKVVWRTSEFGFLGIDFETFFGGGDPSWATPVDQYAYFKGFSMTVLA